MSTERMPLLSDDVVRFKSSPLYVRDFYEDLITSGKLRVAEEVTYVPMQGSHLLAHCSGCGRHALLIHDYCPGCGNKIKRP